MQVLARRLGGADPGATAFCNAMSLQSTSDKCEEAHFTVAVSSCIVHLVPAPVQHGFVQGIWGMARGAPDAWDLGAPWHPWAEQPEPVKAIHIDLIWGLVSVQVRVQCV
jgi:hypothetical protein